MNRLLLIVAILSFVSCKTDTELFDEVNEMAQFDKVYKPTLIQSGKESGFLEPMAEYSLFRIDSLDFRNLENSILANDRFKEGSFYFNIELNDFIYNNDLEIVNMSKSLITENEYDKIYYLYLLSDRETFAVYKVNH
ncbi:hypothetical protein [Aequorivita antarctica]|uniref:Uncharacterized protein n=1 Tax=Aequorivita antarctica TaxID=153266 RepID=A0A5C6Z033_9FLAO|nr:hypothetical protein [Aequorivita antarctica]TXD73341.1 hypothetical protein ESU54_09420 [Aequorivita antarctica]SRX76527.1 hypothetical protein AEQU3_03527 [Aequorivita antarctica]